MTRTAAALRASEHAMALFDSYRSTGIAAQLIDAVNAYRQAIQLGSDRYQEGPAIRFLLCIALRELYLSHYPDISILREAVGNGLQGSRSMSPESPSFATGVLNLAAASRELASATRELDALKIAIDFGQWAAKSLPSNHPLMPDALSGLAEALFLRYEIGNNVNDLHEVARIGRSACAAARDRPEIGSDAYYNQAKYLCEVYKRLRIPGALDEALAAARQGVAASQSSPHNADHRRMLGNILQDLARDRHALNALREAVEVMRPATAQPPQGLMNHTTLLISLSSALVALGEATQDTRPIMEAIHWLRRASDLVRGEGTLEVIVGDNLVAALDSLHTQTRDPQLLHQSMEIGQQLLRQTAETDKEFGNRAGHLGAAMARYATATADEALADESIPLLRRAVRDAVGDRLTFFRYCLYDVLRRRYNQRGGVEVLRETLEQARLLVKESDQADPLQGEYLYSLGSSLLILDQETSEPNALDDGVNALRAAVATAQDPSRYHARLETLAAG